MIAIRGMYIRYRRSSIERSNMVFIRQVRDLVPPTHLRSVNIKEVRNRTRRKRRASSYGDTRGRPIKNRKSKKEIERRRGTEEKKRRWNIFTGSRSCSLGAPRYTSQCTGCVQIRVFVWQSDCRVKYTMTLNRPKLHPSRASSPVKHADRRSFVCASCQ